MNEINKYYQSLIQDIIALQASSEDGAHRSRHLPALPLICLQRQAKLKMQLLPTMKRH